MYNNKNKLIKSKISTIKPTHISKVTVNKKEAIEIARAIEEADKYSLNVTKAILKKGNYHMPYYWKITLTEPGTKWKGNVYIDATSGDTFNPLVNLI